MARYSTYLVADAENRRDYRDRQLFANQQGADVYVEFHFNANAYDKPGTSDNPASALVCDNASQKSRDMAADFAKRVAYAWGFPNRGVVELKRYSDGTADRAYWNLYYTNMKAFLLEPLFVSDIQQAEIAMSEDGQRKIAKILANVIREHYPSGATVACSLGHKFKASSVYDRGAPVKIDIDDDPDDPKPIYHPTIAEADLAEKVMHFFIQDLEGRDVQPDEEVFLEGEWAMSATNGGILLRKTHG